MSSNPASAMSAGTARPPARSRASAPIAITSVTANTQSGSGACSGPAAARTVLIAS
jgi:hypothetical protein